MCTAGTLHVPETGSDSTKIARSYLSNSSLQEAKSAGHKDTLFTQQESPKFQPKMHGRKERLTERLVLTYGVLDKKHAVRLGGQEATKDQPKEYDVFVHTALDP